ncbi:MAG TPA: MotA/TolQ/ExbB proton channel family protein [Planctomycetaceae bacterium]|nr:MotA/TolQ/ExbB proton channel family protein [Planctomycetaceae bacterium]
MTRRRNVAELGTRRVLASGWRLAMLVCLLVGVLAAVRSLTSTTWAQPPADREAASGLSPTDDLAGPPSQTETVGTTTKKSSEKNGKDKGAEKVKGIPTTPNDIVTEMGVWMIPFAASSILAVWFSIERLVVLRKRRVIPKAFVDRLLANIEQGKLDAEQSLKLCDENDSPTAQVFAHALRKWGKPSVEIEQAIIDGGERAIGHLRVHLRALSFIASINPLIGLYGTVVGMILAFNDIAKAGSMGRTDQLATGIGLALLTTAFGLSIAIPTQTMYTFFVAKIDSLVSEIDGHAQTLVNLISSEALSGNLSTLRPKLVRRPLASAGAESKKVAATE